MARTRSSRQRLVSTHDEEQGVNTEDGALNLHNEVTNAEEPQTPHVSENKKKVIKVVPRTRLDDETIGEHEQYFEVVELNRVASLNNNLPLETSSARHPPIYGITPIELPTTNDHEEVFIDLSNLNRLEFDSVAKINEPLGKLANYFQESVLKHICYSKEDLIQMGCEDLFQFGFSNEEDNLNHGAFYEQENEKILEEVRKKGAIWSTFEELGILFNRVPLYVKNRWERIDQRLNDSSDIPEVFETSENIIEEDELSDESDSDDLDSDPQSYDLHLIRCLATHCLNTHSIGVIGNSEEFFFAVSKLTRSSSAVIRGKYYNLILIHLKEAIHFALDTLNSKFGSNFRAYMKYNIYQNLFNNVDNRYRVFTYSESDLVNLGLRHLSFLGFAAPQVSFQNGKLTEEEHAKIIEQMESVPFNKDLCLQLYNKKLIARTPFNILGRLEKEYGAQFQTNSKKHEIQSYPYKKEEEIIYLRCLLTYAYNRNLNLPIQFLEMEFYLGVAEILPVRSCFALRKLQRYVIAPAGIKAFEFLFVQDEYQNLKEYLDSE
ncbi:uncharacterized protein KGF55_002657 [Candida pseudojiufengensis]|uniref:uncharacterized protein n=1 Tax=Candida pseudojiufengensis TaxID=497109 RepID=UPI0022255A79|nr:uncharacterized protein KGF55_002657 [Candida pseudojiufengensis]KAI5963777.1 hypothetical protein KGF55_002657 [Candida pseudojiufengensis]